MAIVAGAGPLVVAAGIALLLVNIVGLRSTVDASVRADRYLLRAAGVERLVVDAETGLRGYLVTGRRVFLQPLVAAEAQLPRAYADLRNVAHSDVAFSVEVQRLVGSAQSYIVDYVRPQLALAARSLNAARSFAATAAGKRRVDDIRAQTATLEALVAERQRVREQRAHSTADHAISVAIVLLVVLTALMLLLSAYLGRVAVHREQARERAARTAEVLQRSLLPGSLPALPGVELAVRFLPESGGAVGGDFYDVWELEPGAWGILVGDVCGKGYAAAATGAMARWTLRTLAGAGASPEAVLAGLNEAMLRQERQTRFVTAAYVKLTLTAGAATAQIACAGHPPPLLVSGHAGVTAVPASGDLLGLWGDFRVVGATVGLKDGDSLVLYTDGVSDQGSARRRSPQRVVSEVPEGATAATLADRLVDFATGGAAHQRDDIAVLALRLG